MRRLFVLLCCGLLLSFAVACDEADESVQGEAEEESASVEESEVEEDPMAHMRFDEQGAPRSADPELREAYMDERAANEEWGDEFHPRFEVIDRDGFDAAVNTEILADWPMEVSGRSGNQPARVTKTFDGLDEMSEDEILEACEAISAYLAEVPESVEMVGPVVFVGSTMVERESDGRRESVLTHVFYNDRLMAGEAGSCTIL